MCNITCSYTCLRCMFCKLLTLDHALTFDLQSIYIKCAEAAKREIRAIIHTDVNNSSIVTTENDNPYLFKALHGLNIRSLSLSAAWGGLNVDHEESLSQSLSSLTQLETLSIQVWYDNPYLFKALHGLNIRSLSLSAAWGSFNVDHEDSMSQSLSSLTQLETLSIEVVFYSPGLWKSLHGLNIKSLSLSIMQGRLKDHEESLLQSLSSLTQLESLSIRVRYDSLGLWKALHGLNIKSLSLSGTWGSLNVDHEESLSQSLSSLTQLETLSIEVKYDSPRLLKALHGLNIKSLSLRGFWEGLYVENVEWQSQSLSSLTQLETLSIEVWYYSPGLWKALHGLNIKSLSLSVKMHEVLNVADEESLSQSLSSLTQLETLNIEVEYDSPGLWKALHGLNIRSLSLSLSLSLSIMQGGWDVDHKESLSQSLSSLTQLETLSIEVKYDSPGLWKALHGLNIKSLKYFNIYCGGLLPSEVLELVDTLPTCTQKVGSNMKLCCSLEILIVENIPLVKYTVIQQELETRKNVTVERFQISERKLETNFVIQCE
ncbi:hypothetical protein DPMN_158450 [Dreissena polymorpha]|uniref:Uncharacterized protein n=1 Tax=Dreissena polymorpha TaxID=45954 RepID=A0A9D4EJ41_DREPO|nr:hypothetical protein DPMN_158450 [Dreissena polymorpha]